AAFGRAGSGCSPWRPSQLRRPIGVQSSGGIAVSRWTKRRTPAAVNDPRRVAPPVTRGLPGLGGAWVPQGATQRRNRGFALRGHHLTDHRRAIRHWITSFLSAREPGGPEPRRREVDRRCRLPAPITDGPRSALGPVYAPIGNP